MASTLVTCASCGVKNSPDRTACLQCGADIGTLTLPLHLAPLLLPTPSGVAKLVGAWDGLTTETQILILSKLEVESRPANLDEAIFTVEFRPAYLKEKICAKALDSANAYIRYLAASILRSSGDDDLKQCIEKDTDPLVRYSQLERRNLSIE